MLYRIDVTINLEGEDVNFSSDWMTASHTAEYIQALLITKASSFVFVVTKKEA